MEKSLQDIFASIYKTQECPMCKRREKASLQEVLKNWFVLIGQDRAFSGGKRNSVYAEACWPGQHSGQGAIRIWVVQEQKEAGHSSVLLEQKELEHSSVLLEQKT